MLQKRMEGLRLLLNAGGACFHDGLKLEPRTRPFSMMKTYRSFLSCSFIFLFANVTLQTRCPFKSTCRMSVNSLEDPQLASILDFLDRSTTTLWDRLIMSSLPSSCPLSWENTGNVKVKIKRGIHFFISFFPCEIFNS